MESHEEKTKDYIDSFRKTHGDAYGYENVILDEDWFWKLDKLRFDIHCRKCGKYFSQRLVRHLNGARCPTCFPTGQGVGITREDVIKKFVEKHGDKFDYSKVIYKGSAKHVKIFCKTCNRYFMQTPCYHKSEAKGCPLCYKDKYRRVLTPEELLQRLLEKHGDNFEYDVTGYKKQSSIIKVYCKTCETWAERAVSSCLSSSACKTCRKNKEKAKRKKKFFERATEVHGDKYGYEKTIIYGGVYGDVEIYCKECQEYFTQQAWQHIRRGEACPKCKEKGRKKEIIEELRKVHGDRYDYSELEFFDKHTKNIIVCNECGRYFSSSLKDHSKGRKECPNKCYEEKLCKSFESRNTKTKITEVEKEFFQSMQFLSIGE